MTSTAISSAKNNRPLLKTMSCAILVIFFLFFIDEGYYNFRWMRNAGNWIAFGIYLSAFILGQGLTYFLFLRNYKGDHKITLTNVIGISLGFIMVLGFFFLLSSYLKA